ncbi:DUF2793 domain-containing protein [Pseudodonghicola flavimaris]|uniref:DUF2793 domain-containing protein n=1 Tax=Pseudodonghicola flavimaris TaxID=3050036 RepID=A0ABT7F808_9RHOB|nr:DUF2793 domain-containing protein [Pseudodonghicola flavimaris]MDK3020753.1 DUF2793 domain-containing protein [Pseudodonghicola flavimaris]
MSDSTPILALPFLVPNQAQPFVTHNGALRRLDVLVQLSVAAFGAETPPELPEEGVVYALGPAPVGDWAGQGQMLAARTDTGWMFIAPVPGWRGWSRQTAELRIWDGTAWVLPRAAPDQLDGIGIGTDHDPVNRLAVKAAATLLSHAGAGHQLKINKAAAGDTASLLFQSGWTGHAELGLAGGTDWSLKVSPDGSSWIEALSVAAASGRLRVPALTVGGAGIGGAGIGLADGAAAQIDPGPPTGFALLSARPDGGPAGTDLGALVHFACASPPAIQPLYAGALTETTTGALTGSSGPAGRLILSAAADGQLYVENRSGAALTVSLHLLG